MIYSLAETAAYAACGASKISTLMPTRLLSRILLYGMIFVAWLLAVGFIELWLVHGEGSPATHWLEVFTAPGVLLIFAIAGVEGFDYDRIDKWIIIVASAAFWLLLTMLVIELWSAVRRRRTMQP